MENRRKRKGPVILLMLFCVLISLGAGVVIGNSGMKFARDIKNMLPATEQETIPITGQAPEVQLHPLPEYTDGGYDTTEIFEKVNPSVVSINVYAGTSVLGGKTIIGENTTIGGGLFITKSVPPNVTVSLKNRR